MHRSDTEPGFHFMAASRSDPGQRDNNEDIALVESGDACGQEGSILFGVIDGMGGYEAGEVAAYIAGETIRKHFTSGGNDLGQAIIDAHDAIVGNASEHPERSGMGAVLTVAIVERGRLWIGHVGDTRLYRFRDGQLIQLTPDQSAVGSLVRAGYISRDSARVHPMRAIVSQAIGHAETTPVPALDNLGVQSGDTYLACSDGLTDVITDEQIVDIVSAAESLDEAAERLVAEALRDQLAHGSQGEEISVAGGRDNISVALVHLADPKSQPSESSHADNAPSFLRKLISKIPLE